MRDDLGRYKIGGASTIHFTPAKPLPKKLIQRIARARLGENRARRHSPR